jgi:hypothetical protein
MQSKAATVEEYLAELPPERRAALEAVRNTILKNLDKGFQERMAYGMIGYSVPHSIYPSGYHCDPRQPLPYAGLASQKNHLSLYLMGMYCSCIDGKESDLLRWFRAEWEKTGKKLDMGRACIRFKKLDDLPLDLIGEAIRRVPVKKCIDYYEAARGSMNTGAAGGATSAAKGAARKPASKSKRSAKPASPGKKQAARR